MEIKASKCNWCESSVFDSVKFAGWIRINSNGLSIQGCEGKTERYSSIIKTTANNDQIDFCSARCFLHWLYLSRESNNGNKKVDYSSPFYQMIRDELGIFKLIVK